MNTTNPPQITPTPRSTNAAPRRTFLWSFRYWGKDSEVFTSVHYRSQADADQKAEELTSQGWECSGVCGQFVNDSGDSLLSLLRLYLNRAESRLSCDTRSADYGEIFALRDAVRTVNQIREGAECGRGACLHCDAIALLLDEGPPVPDALNADNASGVSSNKSAFVEQQGLQQQD